MRNTLLFKSSGPWYMCYSSPNGLRQQLFKFYKERKKVKEEVSEEMKIHKASKARTNSEENII